MTERGPIDQYEAAGKQVLIDKVNAFTSVNQPIQFVMLGFPFKSINKRDKVLGVLPDAAEEATFANFATFASKIKEVYAPGINVNIASDGYMFNDVLKETDAVVQAYNELCRAMLNNNKVPHNYFELTSFYNTDVNTGRDKATEHFGISWEELEQRILFDPDVNYLYKGMIIFMEQEIADKGYSSRNQAHKEAKRLTREMMLRNETYSALIRHEFSSSIRLSMHKTVNNGTKYGFRLIPGQHTHHSAWHSALVKSPGELITMHKHDAEVAGYELVYQDGRPYYYITDKAA